MFDRITGEEMFAEVIDRVTDPKLTEIEQRFITRIIGKTYWTLTRHEKAIVNRIYGWLNNDWLGEES